MKTSEDSIERVQALVDKAERLGTQTVAVPLRDLQTLLWFAKAIPRRNYQITVANGINFSALI